MLEKEFEQDECYLCKKKLDLFAGTFFLDKEQILLCKKCYDGISKIEEFKHLPKTSFFSWPETVYFSTSGGMSKQYELDDMHKLFDYLERDNKFFASVFTATDKYLFNDMQIEMDAEHGLFSLNPYLNKEGTKRNPNPLYFYFKDIESFAIYRKFQKITDSHLLSNALATAGNIFSEVAGSALDVMLGDDDDIYDGTSLSDILPEFDVKGTEERTDDCGYCIYIKTKKPLSEGTYQLTDNNTSSPKEELEFIKMFYKQFRNIYIRHTLKIPVCPDISPREEETYVRIQFDDIEASDIPKTAKLNTSKVTECLEDVSHEQKVDKPQVKNIKDLKKYKEHYGVEIWFYASIAFLVMSFFVKPVDQLFSAVSNSISGFTEWICFGSVLAETLLKLFIVGIVLPASLGFVVFIIWRFIVKCVIKVKKKRKK